MKRDKLITKVAVPIVCAVIAAVGGFIGGNSYSLQQNSEINVEISNVLNLESGEINQSTDLRTSTNSLIAAYESTKQELEDKKSETDSLQSDYEQLQGQVTALQQENARLSDENTKLKDFLLKDNIYVDDVEDLVVVKQVSDKLHDLYLIDSDKYGSVEGMRDLYGDAHSVSYTLHPDSTAWAKYRLNQKYDIFNANVATNQNTGEDVRISIEVYVDDVLVKRVDDIVRNTNLVPLGPISVRNGEILTIKALTLEGNSYRGGYCYITDDSLSVVE